jgi:hypothetical protein
MTNDINEQFGQKILEKIKEEKIAPKPRWQFLLRKYMIWGSGFLALIVGSLAVSVIVYFIKDENVNMYQKMDGSWLKFLFLTLPYFWLIFLALFIFIFYYNLKHTGRGYRYPVIAAVAVSIFSSLFFGAIFFQLGVGRLIDDLLGERTPLYSSVLNRQMIFWNAPEEGRLTGLVVLQTSVSEFILLDIDRETWQVVAAPDHYFLPGIIAAGKPIRIMGVKTDDNIFQARDIFPVGPGRRFFHRFEDDPRFPSQGGMMPPPLP